MEKGGSIPAWAGEPQFTTSRRVNNKVYPRVGGGTLPTIKLERTAEGLSPRGAGEPQSSDLLLPPSRVYPRVGGGTPSLRGLIS